MKGSIITKYFAYLKSPFNFRQGKATYLLLIYTYLVYFINHFTKVHSVDCSSYLPFSNLNSIDYTSARECAHRILKMLLTEKTTSKRHLLQWTISKCDSEWPEHSFLEIWTCTSLGSLKSLYCLPTHGTIHSRLWVWQYNLIICNIFVVNWNLNNREFSI